MRHLSHIKARKIMINQCLTLQILLTIWNIMLNIWSLKRTVEQRRKRWSWIDRLGWTRMGRTWPLLWWNTAVWVDGQYEQGGGCFIVVVFGERVCSIVLSSQGVGVEPRQGGLGLGCVDPCYSIQHLQTWSC